MDSRIPHAFQEALKKAGIVHLSEEEEAPPELIPYGSYSLIDNTALAVMLCDTVATHTKAFWTYAQFIALQNTTQQKPTPPDPNDPQFIPPKDKKYPPDLINKYGLAKVRAVDTAKAYNVALKTHETNLKKHSRLRTQILSIREDNNFNPGGYVATFLSSLQVDFPGFVENFFFTPKTLWVNEEAREAHTFICAGTKSGKSQTILHLVRHYLTTNTEPALVVLDPHGDLAEDVARFQENATNGRLVYIKPNLFNGKRYIAFNPFDIPPEQKLEKPLRRAQLQYRGALQQIIGEDFTKAQKPFLAPCLGVLLHKEGTTFKDLVRFMDDKRNSDLVKYGCEKLPNETDRDFFRYRFHSSNYDSTKEALSSRFSDIIGDPSVRDFLCNESTFDLPACMEAGKLVVFHFDQDEQSEEAVKTIGQLINAYLVSYAMRRKKGNRRPIHLFADECQYFVSPTISQIMGETRKFGLYATLATQRTEQVGADLLDAILGNVGCYMIGRNKGKTAKKMGEEQPITAEDIRVLNPMQFYQIEFDREPVITTIPIVSEKYALKGEAWRDLLLEQGRLYYRSGLPAPEYTSSPTPADMSEANQQRQHQNQLRPLHKIPDVS